MITTCTECQARYQLDAEKIPPRVIKVRCPSCGGVFSLDGSQAKEEAARPPEEPQVVQGGFGDFSSGPAENIPAAQVPSAPKPAPPPVAPAIPQPQTVEPAAPEPVAAKPAAAQPAAPEPVVAKPAAAQPAAPEPVAAKPAAAQPAAGVAVMDRPAAATSRRRKSKEEMLARALISDILVYNRDLYDKAKAEGNLLEALGPEIKKSWELYKEKVTPEVANATNHFREALNEILADGENIF